MDKNQLKALITAKAKQMNESAAALGQHVVATLGNKNSVDESMVIDAISKFRCAFNNPSAPSNIKVAKQNRGMAKILGLLERFKF